jgi:hypothetical protein
MMDEKFVVELIEDLEHMGQLLDRCVRRLRTWTSGNTGVVTADIAKPSVRMPESQNDLRTEIGRQRNAILAQVEQVKAQAMSAVAAAHSGAGGMGMTAGMPGFGPSMASMAGMPGVDPEKLKELQQKIAEMAGNKK